MAAAILVTCAACDDAAPTQHHTMGEERVLRFAYLDCLFSSTCSLALAQPVLVQTDFPDAHVFISISRDGENTAVGVSALRVVEGLRLRSIACGVPRETFPCESDLLCTVPVDCRDDAAIDADVEGTAPGEHRLEALDGALVRIDVVEVIVKPRSTADASVGP